MLELHSRIAAGRRQDAVKKDEARRAVRQESAHEERN